MTNIVLIGGGAFGTAVAKQLSSNDNNKITLLVRDSISENDINENSINSKYFPGRHLEKNIKASTNFDVLSVADLVIITLPSHSILSIVDKLKETLAPKALVVNMAKGILKDGETIVSYLRKKIPNQEIITWKGASFSVEMMNQAPTLLTLGYDHMSQVKFMFQVIEGTNLYMDYTTDIQGVELLSALKNIYAILLGNIDACFNSANTRFMILTKAFGEIRLILNHLGGKEGTLFLGCGIGDISLTALNDLSRNRTLGLLVGKGFYNGKVEENSVVLEGIKTMKLISSVIDDTIKKKLPLFNEMVSLFVDQKKSKIDWEFDSLMKQNFTTVLTYGTFDLIHYGHLEVLRRAKALGDRLIVGLSTDEFNAEKGKICEMPFEKRKEFLESIDYVDMVIPESNWEQKIEDVQNFEVDVFVMGDDWKGKFDFLLEYCKVVYLPRTKGISTTVLKSIIKC